MRIACALSVVSALVVLTASAAADGDVDGGKSSSSFPIPQEAETAMTAEFKRVIDESRATDVSVTPPRALLYHGLQLVQEEEYEKAIPFLEEAIRRDPSLTAGWEGLGWSYIRTDQRLRARDLWSYFCELMPKNDLPYSLLAQYDLLEKDWAAADRNFRRALAINPRQYDLRFSFAQNLMRMGGVDEAEKVFRALIKEDEERLDVQIALAQMLMNRFGDEEAVEIYRKATEEIPDNVKLMYERATLETRVGEFKSADQLCLDILHLETNHVGALRLRADIAEISGQDDMRPLVAIIKATENPIVRAELRMRLAVRCASINRRSPGRYDEDFILGQMRKSIDDNPAESSYKVAFAFRLIGVKRYAQAKRWAEEVLVKHNPHHSIALNVLFEIAMARQDYNEALHIIGERYRTFDRRDPMRYFYLARIYTMQGEYPRALEYVKKLEECAADGAVFTLGYTGLTESDWVPTTSVRRLAEHIRALQNAGWTLVSPAELPEMLARKRGRRVAGRARRANKEEPPYPARVVDWVGYMFTGKHHLVEEKIAGEDEEEDDEEREVVDPAMRFTVVFDDGLRSSLVLGSMLAEEMGVPFGFFTSTQPTDSYEPLRAGWEEIRLHAASGNWVIGSNLHGLNRKQAVDSAEKDLRPPLINRLWNKDRGRLESLNEWDRRIRKDVRASRSTLRRELGTNDCRMAMVSYPLGTIGQDGSTNVRGTRSLMDSLLAEMSHSFKLGFVLSQSGYTMKGDDLLACRKYCPYWNDEGQDVVQHAYEYHPIFLARRMRAEIAMLMNRPEEANAMLAQLRESGYPEEECYKIESNIKLHFRNRAMPVMRPLLETVMGGSQRDVDQSDAEGADRRRKEAQERVGVPSSADAQGTGSLIAESEAAESARETKRKNPSLWQRMFGSGGDAENYLAMSDDPPGPADGATVLDENDPSRYADGQKRRKSEVDEGDSAEGRIVDARDAPWVNLQHPFVAPDVLFSKANDQIENVRYGVKAGLHLNNNTSIHGDYHRGTLKQTVRPYWNAVSITDVPYEQKKYRFKLKKEEIRGGLNYRTDTGVMLFGTVGEVTLRPENWRRYTDEFDGDWLNLQDELNSEKFTAMKRKEHETVFSVGARWNPWDNLSLTTFLDHDYVPSAVKAVTYDSLAVSGEWLPTDFWKISFRDQYWTYDDDNAMYYARLDSLWELSEKYGIWGGAYASVVSTSDPTDFYWTPYWERRIMGVLRYSQESDEYSFKFDMLAGVTRSDGRGSRLIDDEFALAKDDSLKSSYIADKDKDTDWESAWGFSGMYSRKFGRYFTVALEFEILAMRSYIDHSVMLMLMWNL